MGRFAAPLLFLILLSLPAFCAENMSMHYAYPTFPAQGWEEGNSYVWGSRPFWFYAPSLANSLDSLGLERIDANSEIAVAAGQEKEFSDASAHMRAAQKKFAAAKGNYTLARQLLREVLPIFALAGGLDASAILSWAMDAPAFMSNSPLASSVIERRTFAIYAYLAEYPLAWRNSVSDSIGADAEIGRGLNSALEKAEGAYAKLELAGAGDSRYGGEGRQAHLEYRNAVAQIGAGGATGGWMGKFVSIRNSTDWLYAYIGGQPKGPDFGKADMPSAAEDAYVGEESALFGISALHGRLVDALALMESERADAEASAEGSIADADAALRKLTDEKISSVGSGLVESEGHLVAVGSAKPFAQRVRAQGSELSSARRLQKEAAALAKKKSVKNYLSGAIYGHLLADELAARVSEDSESALRDARHAVDGARDAAVGAIEGASAKLFVERAGLRQEDLQKVAVVAAASARLDEARRQVAAGDGEPALGNGYLRHENAHAQAVEALRILQTGMTQEAAVGRALEAERAIVRAKADGLDVSGYETVLGEYRALLEKSGGADVREAGNLAIAWLLGELKSMEAALFAGLEGEYGGILHSGDGELAALVAGRIGEYYADGEFDISKSAGNYRKIRAGLEAASMDVRQRREARARASLEDYGIAVFEEPAVLGETQKALHVLRFSSDDGFGGALKFDVAGIPDFAAPVWEDGDIASVKGNGKGAWEVSMRAVGAEKEYEIEFSEERHPAAVLRRENALVGAESAGLVERAVEFDADADVSQLTIKEAMVDGAANPSAFFRGEPAPAQLSFVEDGTFAIVVLRDVKKGRNTLGLSYEISQPLAVARTDAKIAQNGLKSTVSYGLALLGARERYDSAQLRFSDFIPQGGIVGEFSAVCGGCPAGDFAAGAEGVEGGMLAYTVRMKNFASGAAREVRVSYQIDNSSEYAKALLDAARESAQGISPAELADAEKYIAAGDGGKAVASLLSAKRQQDAKPAYDDAIARLQKKIADAKAAGVESLDYDAKGVQKALLAISGSQEALDSIEEKARDGKFMAHVSEVAKAEADFTGEMRTALLGLARNSPAVSQDAVRYAAEGDFASAISELRLAQGKSAKEKEMLQKREDDARSASDGRMLALKDSVYGVRRALEQYAADYADLKGEGVQGIFSIAPSDVEKGLQEIEGKMARIAKKAAKTAEDAAELEGMAVQVANYQGTLASHPQRMKDAAASSLRVAQAAYAEAEREGRDPDGAVAALWRAADKKCGGGEYAKCAVASRKVVAAATAALDGKKAGGGEAPLLVAASLVAIAGGLALLFFARKGGARGETRKLAHMEDGGN